MARQIPDLTTHLDSVAEPGEQLESATWAYLRPPLAKLGYALGWMGILSFGRRAANSAAREISATAKIPLHGNMVMALTNQRLLIWEGNMTFGKVSEFVGSVPRSQISDMHAMVDGGKGQLRIDPMDGRAVTVITPADPEEFVAAWHH